MKRALVSIVYLALVAVSPVRAADEFVVVDAVKGFPEECKLVRQVALPFEWRNGQMIVDVSVNEHPLHFVVDTGGVFSAIDHNVAKSIGLDQGPLGADYTIADTGGASIRHIVRIDDIKFGTIKSRSLTLLSVALPKGEDGILAPDLLRNFDVEFDPAHQVINLYKPHPCSDHVVNWTNDFAKIHIMRTDLDQIRIPVSIDGMPARAVLDTGLAHTFIGADATASVLGSKVAFGPIHHMAAESGGDLSGSEVKLDSFLIGKLNLVGAVVLANAHAPGWQFAYSQSNPLVEAPGGGFNNIGSLYGTASTPSAGAGNSPVLIGTDISQNLHMLVDYQSWEIYISRK